MKRGNRGDGYKGLPAAASYFWGGGSDCRTQGGHRERKESIEDGNQLSCDLWTRSKGGR